MRELEHLLAHDLGGEEPLRLIGQVIRRIERDAFGQVFEEQGFECVHIGAVNRRHGNELDERIGAAVLIEYRQQLRLRHQVDLVESQDHRRLDLVQDAEQMPIARPRLGRRIDDKRHDVDLAHRLERGMHHPDIHAMRRFVYAGRVHEDHLGIRIVLHAHHTRTRRLRLVGHDRQLLADDEIEERGLAGIGTAEERDEPALHCVRSDVTSRRRARTFVIRRRSTSSTSNDRPSTSSVSPTYGIRPRCESR